jgi:hypothetical protein
MGICCSGGGIRSASFNLGALQALTKHAVIRRARYISAVSGGAYIASALVSIQPDTSPSVRSSFYEAGRQAFEPSTPEVAHLRRNTTYLAPNGLSKAMLALRLFGGLTINVVFGLLLLFILSRPLGWMLRIPTMYGDFFCGPTQRRTIALLCGKLGEIDVPFALWVAVLWPAALAGLLGLIAIMRRWSQQWYVPTLGLVGSLALLSAVMFVSLILLPWLGTTLPRVTGAIVDWLVDFRGPDVEPAATPNFVWLANLLGVGALGAAIVRILTRQSARIAKVFAAVLFPTTVLVAAALMVVEAARGGLYGPFVVLGRPYGTQFAWWVVAIVLFVIMYMLGDLIAWSMHPFYKRRLCIAFSLRRTGSSSVQELRYDDLAPLSHYDTWADCLSEGHVCDASAPHSCDVPGCTHECRRMPEIVICAAANVTERGGAPTGRAAVPFTFGPREIGGREVGWIATKEMEASLAHVRARDITLPAAVAISGAAISPAMGKMTRPSIRALLTLTNARLGVWLPNPRFVTRLGTASAERPDARPLLFRDVPRPNYLAKEALGLHRKGDRFLYVTDGGHVENLGIVELLRRGCTEIYCFDASGDQVDTFFTLGEAVGIARSELGVDMDLDPTALRRPDPDQQPPQGQQWSIRDVEVGSFRYPPDEFGRRIEGRIVYTKAVVTTAATWDVKAYGEKDETFPTLGTANQLFTEARFDAYRELGFGAGDRAAGAARSASLPRSFRAVLGWLTSPEGEDG